VEADIALRGRAQRDQRRAAQKAGRNRFAWTSVEQAVEALPTRREPHPDMVGEYGDHL
jgi:hypothetical protein